MVEFVQQNNSGPSVFHDLYPENSGQSGLHHVALIVDDLREARRKFAAEGYAEGLYAEMAGGFSFVMIDAVSTYGHMIELYEGTTQLLAFYAMVKEAAKDFDGTHPVRELP